ncbi:hypothetical protein Sden_3488 [Shewanella denitrificans OS217]|jgi:ankyrin repeat protein|uniref:Uncharacterized protein n=1 Tax=Shewanella denitrificans (strain OS217 / ATCC BAA-1090 / DSM 15013) TaxID=318161 RepID=Q12IG3_SHEDO|nr:hypothetical protein Sden_3488 [Shewanella denitrificans OS217]
MIQHNLSKYTSIVLLCFISACNASSHQLERSESNYSETVSNKVLIHMDIETMFANSQLRSLAYAAGKGKMSQIDKLLEQGVDVNAKGTNNATVLFWSMRNKKGFEYLLKQGANPNVVFGDGGSVMHWVARKRDCSMLMSALQHGGNPNLKAGMFGGSPAFETITAGKNDGVPNCLKLLLSKDADIDFQDEQGQSVLLAAADLARFDITLYLLKSGANSKLMDNKQRTVRDLVNSYKGAFIKGSVTEEYWLKVDAWLLNSGE